MDDNDFQKLIQSVTQMGEVMHGKKAPHRHTVVANVRAIRHRTGLSQTQFARMFGVSLRTVQNWEQNRSEPDGPARALLQVVEREPQAVLRALHDGQKLNVE